MSEPRKSTTIQQYISETENENKKLNSRREEIQAELDKIQDDLSMLLDADEIQERISSLNSQRQMIDEGIAKREQCLQQLNEELQQANSAETKQKRIQTCIKQSKKANQANKRYVDLMESLDAELVEKIAAINTAYFQMATAGQSFFNTLELLTPHAKRSVNDPAKDGDLQQAVQQMIDTIEQQGKVDTATARSAMFTSDRHYRKTFNNIDRPRVDHFGYLIFQMRNVLKEQQRRQAS